MVGIMETHNYIILKTLVGEASLIRYVQETKDGTGAWLYMKKGAEQSSSSIFITKEEFEELKTQLKTFNDPKLF